MRNRIGKGALGAVLALGACTTSTPGASPAIVPHVDAGSDADAAPPATCPETVQAFCSGSEPFFGAPCPLRYEQGLASCQGQTFVLTCDGHRAISFHGVDTVDYALYDDAGSLVAIYVRGAGTLGCSAGPADLVASSCGSETAMPCAPPDGGADASKDAAAGD
jgi:hypothetical protein